MIASNQLFADSLAMARRLEAADAAVNARFAERSEDVLPVAGGMAFFCGAGSPLSQAIGAGMNGPVAADEVAKLEEFFRSRDCAVALDVCPYADVTLVEILSSRGYKLTEFTNKLLRTVSNIESGPGPDVRVCGPEEIGTWAQVLGRGFFNREELGPLELRMFEMQFRASAALLAEIDGQPVGGGAFAVHEGIGLFYSDSTIASARGRGVQQSVIRARLAMAAARGCDLAMVSTAPGTTSQRNYERFGFQVVYTRAVFVKE